MDRSIAGETIGTSSRDNAFSIAMPPKIPVEVLVVEDEPLIRIVATDAIADSGVMAWEAGDAAEALEALQKHPHIGLVVTDVNMPGEMDGLDLAETVGETRPEVPVIVTSGQVAVKPEELPNSGAFLPKPYRPEQLVELVHQKLEGLISSK